MQNYESMLNAALEKAEIIEMFEEAPKPEETVKTVLSLSDIAKLPDEKVKKAEIYSFDHDIQIVPIFDPHIGLVSCNMPLLEAVVEYILKTPNCYTILGGDILECATKTSVGLGMYEENLSPKDQFFKAFSLFKPLADRGKILGALTGNHEMRLANFADMNPMEILAHQLEVPYFRYQGFLVIKIKGKVYKVALCHGVSSSSTKTGAVNAMRRQASVVNADLYLSGHIHVKVRDYDIYNHINSETGLLEKRKKWYMVCGSFVEYWESYADMKVLPPADIGIVSATFKGDTWQIDTYIPE